MHHYALKRTPNMYVHTAIYFGKFDLIRDRTQAARKARGCIIFTPKIILLILGKILSASSSWYEKTNIQVVEVLKYEQANYKYVNYLI